MTMITKEQLQELAEAGNTKADAARALGVKRGSLTYYSNKYEIIFSRRIGTGAYFLNSITQQHEKYLEVIRLSKLDYSIHRIARLTELSTRMVQRYRKEAGLVPPKHESPTPEELKGMEALLDEGAPYSEVGRTFGYSRSAVSRHFPGRGFTANQAGEMANAVRKANKAGFQIN